MDDQRRAGLSSQSSAVTDLEPAASKRGFSVLTGGIYSSARSRGQGVSAFPHHPTAGKCVFGEFLPDFLFVTRGTLNPRQKHRPII